MVHTLEEVRYIVGGILQRSEAEDIVLAVPNLVLIELVANSNCLGSSGSGETGRLVGSLLVGKVYSRAVVECEIGETCRPEESRYIFVSRGSVGKTLEVAHGLEGCGTVLTGKGLVSCETGDGGVISIRQCIFYCLNLRKRLVFKLFETIEVVVP